MRDGAVTLARHGAGNVVVRVNGGVTVIADDPEMGVAPVATAFGIVPQARRHVVHDPQRFAHEYVVMPAGVRRLVDAGEGSEQIVGPFLAHALDHRMPHLAVQLEPALSAPTE